MTLLFKKLWPVGVLLLITLIFFLPFLSGEKIPYVGDFSGSDLTELNLPLRFLTAASLQHGQLPLWTNAIASGFPLLAEGQAGVFYPPNFLYVILPFQFAVVIGLALNFFLGGLFLYSYARVLGVSKSGAVLAAVAFAFSGFFIFRIKHLNLINAAIWLPLMLYCVERYFQSPLRWRYVISLVIVIATQFFAGHPQISYISLCGVALYIVVRSIHSGYDAKPRRLKTQLLHLVVGVLLLIGLTAVQLLPTFAHTLNAGRGIAVDYQQIEANSYPLASMVFWLAPYYYGNPSTNSYDHLGPGGIFWENNFYFGLLPLALALIALIALIKHQRTVRLLALVIGIAVFIGLGANNPLFPSLWSTMPGLQLFRFHQRFMLLTLVALTVLAGFGFDYLWRQLDRFVFFKKFPRRLSQGLLPMVVSLIVAVDLFMVGQTYLGVVDYQQYFSPPTSAQYLAHDTAQYRIHSVNWPTIWGSINEISGGWQNNLSLFVSGRELLMPNLNAFWGIDSSQDRASLEGGMLNHQAQQLNGDVMTELWEVAPSDGALFVSDAVMKIFQLQNVKYVLSYTPLSHNQLTVVDTIRQDFLPSLKIYEHTEALPYAFGVFSVHQAADIEAMRTMIRSADFDPRTSVVLLAADSAKVITESGQAEVQQLTVDNGKVQANVSFSQSGVLYLSQTFMPGWRATIDGVKTPVLRANYAFTAIAVSAGQHTVLLDYRPLSFTIGAWMSLVTAGGLLFVGGRTLVRRRLIRKVWRRF